MSKNTKFLNKKQIIKSLNDLNVLIIGDVMIDRYLYGKVDRISPEAPVPVVNLESIDDRLGGAANVALNIISMGSHPILFSVIGDDDESNNFVKLMKNNNIELSGIIKDKERITTVKTRILSKNQQLLRFDNEVSKPIKNKILNDFEFSIKKYISHNKVDVVLFEDYNKGSIPKSIIKSIIKYCNLRNIPTAVDPKSDNFFTYKNVTLFKPNLKEVSDAIGFEPDPNNLKSLNKADKYIKKRLNNKITIITLSENGIYLNDGKGVIIPTKTRNIVDVCGAGDAVVSIVSMGLALEFDMKYLCEIANIAGGIVCQNVGVTTVNKEKLLNEI